MIASRTFALAVLLLTACEHEDVVARSLDDAGTVTNGPGSCEGQPSGVALSELQCQERGRFALCTCEAIVTRAPLTVLPEPGAGLPHASSIGANGTVHVEAPLTIEGALVVSGAGGVSGTQTATVVVEALASQGPIEGSFAVEVGTDAEVGGRITVGDLEVVGTLTVPAGADVSAATEPRLGALAHADVSVEPPCRCEADDAVDVEAAIAAHRADNDNGGADLDPYALDGFTAPRQLTLPCGRYHLARIAGEGAVSIAISGRVALFVDGDVVVDGALHVALAPEAELDLFVRGAMVISGDLTVGDPSSAAQARLWVATSGTVDLGARVELAGDLLASRAELVTRGEVMVQGRVRVRRLTTEAPFDIHAPTTDAICEEAR